MCFGCLGICVCGATLKQKLSLQNKEHINSLAFTVVEKEVDKFGFETISADISKKWTKVNTRYSVKLPFQRCFL